MCRLSILPRRLAGMSLELDLKRSQAVETGRMSDPGDGAVGIIGHEFSGAFHAQPDDVLRERETNDTVKESTEVTSTEVDGSSDRIQIQIRRLDVAMDEALCALDRRMVCYSRIFLRNAVVDILTRPAISDLTGLARRQRRIMTGMVSSIGAKTRRA